MKPAPHLASNSAVVYQSGASQTVDSSFDYMRLQLKTLGGAVVRSFANQTFLTVLEELFIDSNVTASFVRSTLPVLPRGNASTITTSRVFDPSFTFMVHVVQPFVCPGVRRAVSVASPSFT